MPETLLQRVPPEQLPAELRPVWDLATARSDDATAIEAWGTHPAMLDWYFNGFYQNVFYNADARMLVDVRSKELLRIKLSKQHGCVFCNRLAGTDDEGAAARRYIRQMRGNNLHRIGSRDCGEPAPCD